MSDGSVALFAAKSFVCGGDASTDLDPGKYQLIADTAAKQWKIIGVGAKSRAQSLRFVLDLDGPDPFTLSYANPCALEITTFRTSESYLPDPFIEMLPDIGAKAFVNDPDYVDNGLVGGEFDVIGGTFTLRYENGDTLDLTSWVPWATLVDQIKPGQATMYTYYKLKPPQKNRVLPRIFDKQSAPNIAFMVEDIVNTLPGARAGFQLGRILLDFVQIGPRPLGRGVKGPARAPSPRRVREFPAQRISPVRGTVNVGGTGGVKEPQMVTNLNPIVAGTGGATRNIPNLVPARFEDMGDVFLFNSVDKVMANRLPFSTVNWPQAAKAAFAVMRSDGTLQVNVWTTSEAEVNQVIFAFTDAGFRNVRNSTGVVGAGTFITGIK